MPSAILKIRPVHEGDAEGLAVANRSLNSPHAPTDVQAVNSIIQRSQGSISGQQEPTQLNVVAEEMGTDKSTIVGGGAIVKMGSDGEFPILWKEQPDGSMKRFRYTDTTLEFGGVSVGQEYQGKGYGKALTAVRALIATKYANLFGAEYILSDFMPPLDDLDTKENAFWDDLIVPLLKQNGTLQAVMGFCQEKTGMVITNTTQLSSVIGNVMSDADRNEMVDKFFPETIPAELISPIARAITQDVNGPTQAARANLIKIYGEEFQIIGAFPINGGPNYRARAENGPKGEGPFTLKITEEVAESIKLLVFRPIEEGLEGLQKFEAFLVAGQITEARLILSKHVADVAGFKEGEDMMYMKI